MELERKRILLRRIRLWALVIAPLMVGYEAVQAYSRTSSISFGSSNAGYYGSAVGETVGGGYSVAAKRWGVRPYWKYDTTIVLTEVICTALDNGRVTGKTRTTYDVLAIPKPFNLELRDQGTLRVTQRFVPNGDPLLNALNLGWSKDGMLLEFQSNRGQFFAPGIRYDRSALLPLVGRALLEGISHFLMIYLIVLFATMKRHWIRPESAHCPTCGYDLRGNPKDESGCPECGWNRGTAVSTPPE